MRGTATRLTSVERTGEIRRERLVRTIRDISSLCSLREDAGKHEGDELASKR